jgi:outer membrane receptor protein involved in Fe transport
MHAPCPASPFASIRPVLLATLLLLPLALPAQQTRPPAGAGADGGEEEVVTLEAFRVTTQRTNDYVAAESITGTRIASKIIELPFNVNVATKEFIEDFSLTELNEQIGYMSSVGQSEGSALPGSGIDSVPVRGFTSDADLRNGFRRLAGTVHNIAIDRVEAIKGPAAGIYGRIQPGGVVNVVTKKPSAKPAQRVSLSGGNYGQLRAEASSTGPVGKSRRLFYRVDLAASEREFKEDFRNLKIWTGAAQLLWKITPDISLNLELEHTQRNEVPGMFVPIIVKRGTRNPYILNPNGTPAGTTAQFVSPAMPLLYFNNSGPNVWTKLGMSTATMTFDWRIAKRWSLRSGLNIFRREQNRQYMSGVPSVQWANGAAAPDYTKVWNGTRFQDSTDGQARYPDYGERKDGGFSFQTDLAGEFKTGDITHRLLVTADISHQRNENRDWQMRKSATDDPASNGFWTGLDVNNPDYHFTSHAADPSLYYPRRNEHYDNSDTNYGVFVSDRLAFFGNRLYALVGARYDFVHSMRDRKYIAPNADMNGSYITGNEAVYTKADNDNLTYQLGLNYQLFKNTMLYASHSTSYKPSVAVNNAGKTLPNERGVGYEGGVKLSWFGQRLNLTAAYYHITKRNIARSIIIDFDTYETDTFASGEEQSKGVELDFNWQFFPGFQMFAGYGWNDTKITKNDENPFLIGTTPRRVPHHNLGAGLRYEVRGGVLKGLFATFGVRYYGSSIALAAERRTLNPNTHVIINARTLNGSLIFPQFPEGAYLYKDKIIVNGVETIEISPDVRGVMDDGRSQLVNPGYTLLEMGVGYRWRAWKFGKKRLNHRVQLNIKNLADKAYATAALRPGEPRSFLLTYTLNW